MNEVPSNEVIEKTVAEIDLLYKALPENESKRAARHFLAQSERHAHRSREIGDMPYEPDEIP